MIWMEVRGKQAMNEQGNVIVVVDVCATADEAKAIQNNPIRRLQPNQIQKCPFPPHPMQICHFFCLPGLFVFFFFGGIIGSCLASF